MSDVVSMPVRSYRELIAWQKAIDLVTASYEYTRTFPNTERFGLSSQLRRAAVSVPSNIAEGQGRASTGEFNQFLGHARESLLEIETQIFIARNLGFIAAADGELLLAKCADVGRILNGFMGSLKNKKP
jgi:four helix bundle protein